MKSSRFTTAEYELTGRSKNGRPEVCLTSDLSYDVGYLGSGWRIVVKKGFCSDLASLPVLPKWFQPKPLVKLLRWAADQIARSSIVHDQFRQDLFWPKLLGDYVFFEAMGVDKVPMWLRLSCFIVVLCNFSRY